MVNKMARAKRLNMKMLNGYTLFFALQYAFQTSVLATIEFKPRYQGRIITGTVGSSVNFTWTFSGDVGGINWGIKKVGTPGVFEQNLLSLDTAGNPTFTHQDYTGRVSGSRTGDSSSAQVIFTLSSIITSDAKSYLCQLRAGGAVGIDQFDYMELVIEVPANIQFLTSNLTVNEHDAIDLRCDVSGYPAPNISWEKDGKQIKPTGKELHINISKRSDTGAYVCTADNSVGQAVHMKTYVVVNYPAIIESVTSSVSKSWIGQTITLTCKSDGVPTPTLSWYKPDGTKFDPVKAEENTAVVTLNSDGDFGLYNCTADNDFLSASKTVLVEQIRAPGPPIITSTEADIQATSLTVKWTEQTDTGGSPIAAYRVVILQGVAEINNNITDAALRSWPVGNLEMNTNYTVKVFARNYVFEGNAMKKIFKTKFEGIPAAAEIIDLPADTKAGEVVIKWNTPKDNGATITRYTVYQNSVSEGGTPRKWIRLHVITDVSDRKATVKLDKGKIYEFVVTATNKHGESLKEEEKIKRITVGDVPEAVVITGEVIDGEITLKWEEPDNNGAPVTQYDVYQRIVNDKTWKNIGTIKDTSKRKFVVEGEKGKEYEFAVTATNKYGESLKEEDSITRVEVPGVSTKPTENRTGSSCDDEKKRLHAVYMIVILLLLISNLVLIYFLWRMRRRSENSGRNKKCQTCGDLIAMNPILKTVQVEADTQSSSVAQKIDSPTYATPVGADYMPLNPSTKNWEISREHVNIIKVIGKGAFSKVAQATVGNIRDSQEITTVAVKMLKANAPASDRKDLLSELELMKKLKPNPHVIKLIGCVTESDPLLVLIEYVPFGDLLGYLRKSRGLNDTYFKDPDVKPQSSLTAGQLMKFAWQVADGMFYLSSKKIIHRDLAARNVLVGEGEKCKVTDFGMARNVQQDDIYNRTSRGRLPVKWTAYEALMYGTYTTQSDVWSFGVLLYEILTVGGSPYPEINPREIARKLQQGYRMPKPRHVEDKLYQIMLRCWEENPVDRPTFDKLRKTMKEMERNHKTYVNLNQYDHSLYANVKDLTAE